MHLRIRHALLLALLLMCSCAARRRNVSWFEERSPQLGIPTPAPRSEVNPAPRQPTEKLPTPKAPLVVAVVPDAEPTPTRFRSARVRRAKRKKARRKSARVAPITVASATPDDPGKKEHDGSLPPVVYMPFGAAALWMAARAAAHAGRKR
jgi:hypothetical protein